MQGVFLKNLLPVVGYIEAELQDVNISAFQPTFGP
jgi:hypothetical protein